MLRTFIKANTTKLKKSEQGMSSIRPYFFVLEDAQNRRESSYSDKSDNDTTIPPYLRIYQIIDSQNMKNPGRHGQCSGT